MLWSPENTKLNWPEVLVPETELLDELPWAIEEERNSIQGTATCLPPNEEELELPIPLDEVSEVPPAAEVPDAPDVPRLLLEEPEELPFPGEVVEPPAAAPDVPELFSEKIAKSIRPELGLTMKSLIVPSCVPELLVTCAPVS